LDDSLILVSQTLWRLLVQEFFFVEYNFPIFLFFLDLPTGRTYLQNNWGFLIGTSPFFRGVDHFLPSPFFYVLGHPSGVRIFTFVTPPPNLLLSLPYSPVLLFSACYFPPLDFFRSIFLHIARSFSDLLMDGGAFKPIR